MRKRCKRNGVTLLSLIAYIYLSLSLSLALTTSIYISSSFLLLSLPISFFLSLSLQQIHTIFSTISVTVKGVVFLWLVPLSCTSITFLWCVPLVFLCVLMYRRNPLELHWLFVEKAEQSWSGRDQSFLQFNLHTLSASLQHQSVFWGSLLCFIVSNHFKCSPRSFTFQRTIQLYICIEFRIFAILTTECFVLTHDVVYYRYMYPERTFIHN